MSDWASELTDAAKEDLASLDAISRRRVLEKIKWLAENFDEVTPIALGSAWRDFFKLRAGDWRIAYEISYDEQMVTVHMVDHRSKIYKRLPPR